MENVWLRRFAVVVAACTLLLVVAGALVTSNDAALSVPDWPLAWGKAVPPLVGGIRFEFAHRVAAAAVGLMTLALAVWSRRPLAWAAFAAVAAQALLGGAVVKWVDPKALAIAHASLAELVFGLTAALAFRPELKGSRGIAVFAAAALFGQTVLGAALRHHAIGLVPHIVGAFAALIVVMWVGVQSFNTQTRAAATLLGLTFSQIFLGMGAYLGRVMNADAPQPLLFMVGFTVAHVAVGSMAFGTAVSMR